MYKLTVTEETNKELAERLEGMGFSKQYDRSPYEVTFCSFEYMVETLTELEELEVEYTMERSL